MVTEAQRTKATHLLKLHDRQRILVLANAWDVASARIFEEAGFRAIGTTSAGIAASLGYPDGQRISRSEMLDMVRRIASAVKLPVTADMEAGYGDTAQEVAETVKGVIEAGAVGMNLEDGFGPTENRLTDVSLQVEKIKAVREVALSADIQFVLNARTDAYWLAVGDPASRYDDTVRRARAYRQAGADCIFVPGLTDATRIGRLIREINCPVNILASPGAPSIPEIARLGVARVSFGSGPMRASLALARKIAKELLGPGTYSALTQDTIPYADVNRLLERRAPRAL